LPSRGLQNWYINRGVSTTSQSQCAKKLSSSAKSYFLTLEFIGNH
jgi:hypothetical protein